MKIEVWTDYGPQNSKPIFEAFIKSLTNAGEEVVLNRSCNADVAVIWSVLWQGVQERRETCDRARSRWIAQEHKF